MKLDRYIEAFYRGDFHSLRLLAVQARYQRTDLEKILDLRIIEPERQQYILLGKMDPFTYLEEFLSLHATDNGIAYIAGAKHDGYKPLLVKGSMEGQLLTSITEHGKSRLAKRIIDDTENNPYYESDIHLGGWKLQDCFRYFLKLGRINLRREWRTLLGKEQVKYNEEAILELYDEAMVRRKYI